MFRKIRIIKNGALSGDGRGIKLGASLIPKSPFGAWMAQQQVIGLFLNIDDWRLFRIFLFLVWNRDSVLRIFIDRRSTELVCA